MGYGDHLKVYNGTNDQSTLLHNLNGNLGSFNISSSGYSLYVKFYSDASITFSGFLATIHYSNLIDKTINIFFINLGTF